LGAMDGTADPNIIATGPVDPSASVPTLLEMNRRTFKRHALRLQNRRAAAAARASESTRTHHRAGTKVPFEALRRCISTQFGGHKTPQLYIRGIGGQIGSVTGSMEMVADFDVWQAGPFFSGGGDFGTDSFGASVNMYQGFGYKGKNTGSNLYPSYKDWFDGAYGGVSIPIPWCGGVCSANFGALLMVSCPETGLPTPKCDEVITLSFTAGVGVSLIPKINLGVTLTKSVSDEKWFHDCGSSWSKKLCMAAVMGALVPTPDNLMFLALLAMH